ncbi:MAG: NFACT RNA binding domain-containing protein [Candidatus Tyrphobacter sp.]
MRTDWVLVRRLALELQTRLKGARFQDAVLLADGRPAFELWSKGEPVWLCIDLFGSPPLVTLETDPMPAPDGPGFARALARSLRGAVVSEIEARDRDRLLRITFRTRSRFGVTDEWDLFIELVPRFGNAVLVKGETVVSAFKEFAGASGGRTVRAGLRYVLPPLPPQPPLLIEDEDAAVDGPLFVYWRGGTLLQAHVAPVTAFADTRSERSDSLLDLFALDRTQRTDGVAGSGSRRALVVRAIDRELSRATTALEALLARDSDGASADALQREGNEIYATLHELEPAARPAAKERAASLFARAKKLLASADHVERRRQTLRMQLDALEMLAWEAQRVSDDDLGDVEGAFAALERRRPRPPAQKRRERKRELLEVRTANGSRILIGRSPAENARLTFAVARPNDLWFHVRGTPGAHVVLARDDGAAPPQEDILSAAAFAAGRSKAREGAKVTVDYTLRKHVRKQPGAAPGLVYYAAAKSVTVEPEREDEAGPMAASETRRRPSPDSS